jgi:hypothetical protein
MLPPADDSAWEELVRGEFAKKTSCRGHRPLGLTTAYDVGLLRPLCGRHGLLFALLKAGMQLMLPAIWVVQKLTAGLPLPLFQPAYTIDAESKILGPLVKVVAHLLDTQPGLLLKDRWALLVEANPSLLDTFAGDLDGAMPWVPWYGKGAVRKVNCAIAVHHVASMPGSWLPHRYQPGSSTL